ncbi:hypothetical protein [Sedimenticola selenatireducens]|uniref:RRM domain-containing protein n=1 Tax=Sedimenticola selenatireducens TaxID=191960 RepID=A0A558DNH6_9GAMM|nr:hypothetical protein [Sedimenticola selenatireducens]TVO74246.1 hypothetical protein FHP88_10780 [Sedimenticola selenatireducens]TVT62575.1 MAG: hypothetical protein FHK78_14440 [Sedimenticola selenatireducens]
MWIIIQKIPLTTTQRELNLFLNKQINGNRWFGLSSNQQTRLKSFSILRMTDRTSGEIECHGLAEVETSKPEEEMLRVLNGHQLHGQTIAVRKYYHRSNISTQTAHTKSTSSFPGLRDRRRHSLHIEMLKANSGGLAIGIF